MLISTPSISYSAAVFRCESDCVLIVVSDKIIIGYEESRGSEDEERREHQSDHVRG